MGVVMAPEGLELGTLREPSQTVGSWESYLKFGSHSFTNCFIYSLGISFEYLYPGESSFIPMARHGLLESLPMDSKYQMASDAHMLHQLGQELWEVASVQVFSHSDSIIGWPLKDKAGVRGRGQGKSIDEEAAQARCVSCQPGT